MSTQQIVIAAVAALVVMSYRASGFGGGPSIHAGQDTGAPPWINPDDGSMWA